MRRFFASRKRSAWLFCGGVGLSAALWAACSSDSGREAAESSDAPYFVDLVNQTLQNNFGDRDFQAESYKVYTTLDMNLQRDAVAAVKEGIKETDAQWAKRNKRYGTNEDNPLAQVALICLDAETGELNSNSNSGQHFTNLSCKPRSVINKTCIDLDKIGAGF